MKHWVALTVAGVSLAGFGAPCAAIEAKKITNELSLIHI